MQNDGWRYDISVLMMETQLATYPRIFRFIDLGHHPNHKAAPAI